MTAKQTVKAAHPAAVCIPQTRLSNNQVTGFTVFRRSGSVTILGRGKTTLKAWADAAKHPSVVPQIPVEVPPLPDYLKADNAPDMVNHPPHYTASGIECIEAIKAALTPEEFRGFCKGNSLKYAWREKHKGGDEDLKKAQWYLNRITG